MEQKLVVKYDDKGAYITYKYKNYYLNLLKKDYEDFTIKRIITEPLATYIIIKEVN